MAQKKGILRFLVVIIAGLVILLLTAFFLWTLNPLGPGETAMKALESDELVAIAVDKDLVVFTPLHDPENIGLIFYPGGSVDYQSYTPPLRMIAEEDYAVCLVKMPLNLAVLDMDAAANVIGVNSDIVNWVLGGHSLGGAKASSFIFHNPELVDGLVLWASYNTQNTPLNYHYLEIVSAYGSLDKVLNQENLAASQILLPDNTSWAVIEGCNHAPCGDYGQQPGDATATIMPEEQWQQLT